jgi:hypothetical protein
MKPLVQTPMEGRKEGRKGKKTGEMTHVAEYLLNRHNPQIQTPLTLKKK